MFSTIREIVLEIAAQPPSEDNLAVADAIYGLLYEQWIAEINPCNLPIVNEEGALKCVPGGARSWWTVDPNDGSRHRDRGREWFDLVGTMLARVDENVVSAAFVSSFKGYGEGMIGFEADYPPALFRHDGTVEQLAPLNVADASLPLLVRGHPGPYSPVMRGVLRSPRLFGERRILNGSVGLSMFDLWLGRAAAYVLPSTDRPWTPWDMTPVVGICQRLGIKAYVACLGGLCEYSLPLLRESVPNREVVLVHASLAPRLVDEAAIRASGR